MGTSTSTPLAAAALAMPSPPESELAASPVGPDWFVGLTPLQLAPRTVTAMGQFVSVLGQPNNAAAAQMAATLLPCRGGYTSAGGALWARPQPLLLPLSFPQFFAASLGRQLCLLQCYTHYGYTHCGYTHAYCGYTYSGQTYYGRTYYGHTKYGVVSQARRGGWSPAYPVRAALTSHGGRAPEQSGAATPSEQCARPLEEA